MNSGIDPEAVLLGFLLAAGAGSIMGFVFGLLIGGML